MPSPLAVCFTGKQFAPRTGAALLFGLVAKLNNISKKTQHIRMYIFYNKYTLLYPFYLLHLFLEITPLRSMKKVASSLQSSQ